MKITVFILSFLCFLPFAQAIGVQGVYGNKDPKFIVGYNQRLLKDFISYNSELRQCISEEIENRILTEVLPKHNGWGREFEGGMVLLPYFEVFYRSVSADSNLEKGIRVALPEKSEFKLTKETVKTSTNAYGFEIYIDKDGNCVENKIQKFLSHLLFSDGRRLELTTKVFPQVAKYPFFEMIRAELGSQDSGSILFLRTFNVFYLNTKSYLPIQHQQKEFHQFMLRMTWKSPDEYTLYFPQ